MYKSKFTLSDDTEEFEGYTDSSLWNGRAIWLPSDLDNKEKINNE